MCRNRGQSPQEKVRPRFAGSFLRRGPKVDGSLSKHKRRETREREKDAYKHTQSPLSL